MNRTIICLVVSILLLVSLGAMVGAEREDERENYKKLLQTLDGSIVALRHGGSASGGLSQAQELYNSLVEPREENFDDRLSEQNERIKNAFQALQQSANEENIQTLRSNISSMASMLGIPLSPIYEHALFFVLAIAALVAFLITLLNRRIVNWERVRQIKAEVAAFQKELREAQSKRDMKRIYKLQQEQKRVLSLQGEMMKETFKPTIIYIVPWFVFWYLLAGIYSGWVVAWLPFTLPLPFYGTWASCGFLSWYLITYFGFSQVWRKLLIRD